MIMLSYTYCYHKNERKNIYTLRISLRKKNDNKFMIYIWQYETKEISSTLVRI